MALNPAFYVADDLPAPIPGEVFMLRRKHVDFEIDIPGRGSLKFVDSTAYLTTVRICVWLNSRQEGFHAIDIPLQGISQEDVKQPIFGANYLTGVVAPVPDRGLPSPCKWKIVFRSGGFGTFVAVFGSIMERGYRNSNVGARRIFLEQQVVSPVFIQEQRAYFDPSDPSFVYITQPPKAQPGPTPSYTYCQMPASTPVAMPARQSGPPPGVYGGGSAAPPPPQGFVPQQQQQYPPQQQYQQPPPFQQQQYPPQQQYQQPPPFQQQQAQPFAYPPTAAAAQNPQAKMGRW